ncbi:MAG: dodecin domain-containing protein [Acidobacteria bacterium]|nr:dodecin domain-containing protein [Acidobacteriota bacterium]
MAETYKLTEIVGTSTVSMSDAIQNAVAEASKTVRHMAWFEVIETRGRITNGKVDQFQVTLKVGFRLER